MSLIAQAKADILSITTNSDEWAVEITLTAPNADTITIKGLHTKHHMAVDTLGNPVSAKNAHISFSESLLTDEDYPCRNAAGEVDLKGHRVSVADSTGTAKEYTIRQWHPDETIGLIKCLLDDYE